MARGIRDSSLLPVPWPRSSSDRHPAQPQESARPVREPNLYLFASSRLSAEARTKPNSTESEADPVVGQFPRHVIWPMLTASVSLRARLLSTFCLMTYSSRRLLRRSRAPLVTTTCRKQISTGSTRFGPTLRSCFHSICQASRRYRCRYIGRRRETRLACNWLDASAMRRHCYR